MFGLSWGQIAIIVLVGVFVLGPERIPTAVTWVMGTLRKARTMAAGAQEELRREIGPEIDELRRQVADLQSLKELQDLRDLRDLHPKRLLSKNILGDEFAGGMSGFLGLNGTSQNGTAPVSTSQNGTAPIGAGPNGTAPISTVKPSAPGPGAVTPPASSAAATAMAGEPNPALPGVTPAAAHARPQAASAGTAYPPSMTKLAAPKVVGRAPVRAVPAPVQTPFDPDGT